MPTTINGLSSLAGQNVDSSNDKLMIWDDSASASKKITVSAVSTALGNETYLGVPSSGDSILQSTIAGVRSWILKTFFEPALGNPESSGYILSSTDDGVRSWVENSVYQFYSFTVVAGSVNALRYSGLGTGLLGLDYLKSVFPMDVTIDRFYVHNSACGTGTSTGYVKVLKNGVATGIQITGWVSGAVKSDLVNSAQFTGGSDEISFEISPGTGTVDNITISFRVKIK